jgi:REP element-mobilizing transposase RayT
MPDTATNSRRTIRLAGYDYRASGGYFVTLCTEKKRSVFGKVDEGIMRLNPYGDIVERCWRALPAHFAHVVLDEFIIMPNHFHGILFFRRGNEGTPEACPYDQPQVRKFGESQVGTLSVVVGQMKMRVTQAVNAYRAERGLAKATVWQRNYYERIIRDENELNEIRRYIIENPLNWLTDENYP